MKIIGIEPIPIVVPLKKGMTTKTTLGDHVVSPYVIIKIYTDEGIVGLGEATLAAKWSGETSAGCIGAIKSILEPGLIGADPRNINACTHLMDRALKANPFTKAAIEMALWDITGKALSVPVYSLLGGKVRDSMPMKMVVGAFDISTALVLTQKFTDWGVKHLKIKVGINSKQDIARVRAIRKAVGSDVTIGVDANCGWDLSTAKKVLREMDTDDLLFAEQPLGVHDLKAMAALRQSIDIPIMADESVFSLNDAWNLTCHRAADVISIYPGKNGGILASLAITNIAQGAGLVSCMGSNLELGIATAAMLHLAAACVNIDCTNYPGDFLGPLYHEADMISEPLCLGPEVAKVPEGPGLGVELDEDQLNRWMVDL